MNSKINDYNNYDKLTIYVKNQKAIEIIKHYEALGYELIEDANNKTYADTKDLTFVRPHFIKNKDELQLLQVHLEVLLNKQGKLEQNKHSTSLKYGITFAVLGFVFLTLGINHLFVLPVLYQKIISSITGAVGLLMFFLLLIIIPKIIKKEFYKYEKSTRLINNQINKIMEIVKKARGKVNDGKSI